MNRLLFVLVLVVASGVGLGFYRGWFGVTTDSDNGESHITFSVDKDKVQEDEEKALKNLHDLGQKVKDKASTPADNGKSQSNPAAQPSRNQE